MGFALRAPRNPPNITTVMVAKGFKVGAELFPYYALWETRRENVKSSSLVIWCTDERTIWRKICSRKICSAFAVLLHTGKYFRNLIESTRNQIVFTIFRLIWIQMDVRLVPNQSENRKYNLISGWFNDISEIFLCVYVDIFFSVYFHRNSSCCPCQNTGWIVLIFLRKFKNVINFVYKMFKNQIE